MPIEIRVYGNIVYQSFEKVGCAQKFVTIKILIGGVLSLILGSSERKMSIFLVVNTCKTSFVLRP